jgi:hypothetical protein
MTISRLVASPIPSLIRNPLRVAGLFQYGVPLVTQDGALLLTTDNAILLLAGATALSTTPPAMPYFTTDGDGLFTTDNAILTV